MIGLIYLILFLLFNEILLGLAKGYFPTWKPLRNHLRAIIFFGMDTHIKSYSF
jgi:hypothetical protein